MKIRTKLAVSILTLLIAFVAIVCLGVEKAQAQDSTAPTYDTIYTNTTIAAEICEFSVEWTDNVGLSGYIFGTNEQYILVAKRHLDRVEFQWSISMEQGDEKVEQRVRCESSMAYLG